MPYDPQWPQNGQNIDADRFRDQFSGVIDLINAGSSITGVVVDSVTTLPAGSQATVNLNLVGTVLHFSFGLPEGTQGMQGQTGPDGPVGPPFASVVVDAVNTLPAGSAAAVEVTFDGTSARFTFGIPQGSEGATGPTGPPGEVMQVDLDNAITDALTQASNNSNAVNTLDSPFADPDAEALRLAYNDLVLALRR